VTLKANIFRDVPAADVPEKVPAELRSTLDVAQLGNDLFTVISYPAMRGSSNSVVDSKSLLRALKEAKRKSGRIVVVAHNFTAEARDLMEKEDVLGFYQSDFYWSDESWARIRE